MVPPAEFFDFGRSWSGGCASGRDLRPSAVLGLWRRRALSRSGRANARRFRALSSRSVSGPRARLRWSRCLWASFAAALHTRSASSSIGRSAWRCANPSPARRRVHRRRRRTWGAVSQVYRLKRARTSCQQAPRALGTLTSVARLTLRAEPSPISRCLPCHRKMNSQAAPPPGRQEDRGCHRRHTAPVWWSCDRPRTELIEYPRHSSAPASAPADDAECSGQRRTREDNCLVRTQRTKHFQDKDGHLRIAIWRKGRDSNPRWTCAHASFQDWSHQPLGHPSRITPSNLPARLPPKRPTTCRAGRRPRLGQATSAGARRCFCLSQRAWQDHRIIPNSKPIARDGIVAIALRCDACRAGRQAGKGAQFGRIGEAHGAAPLAPHRPASPNTAGPATPARSGEFSLNMIAGSALCRPAGAANWPHRRISASFSRPSCGRNGR